MPRYEREEAKKETAQGREPAGLQRDAGHHCPDGKACEESAKKEALNPFLSDKKTSPLPILKIALAETVVRDGKTYVVNPLTRELRPYIAPKGGYLELSPDVESLLRPKNRKIQPRKGQRAAQSVRPILE